jgi:hypothetical protein
MSEAFQSMNSGTWTEYWDPSIAQIGSMDSSINRTSLQRWGAGSHGRVCNGTWTRHRGGAIL